MPSSKPAITHSRTKPDPENLSRIICLLQQYVRRWVQQVFLHYKWSTSHITQASSALSSETQGVITIIAKRLSARHLLLQHTLGQYIRILCLSCSSTHAWFACYIDRGGVRLHEAYFCTLCIYLVSMYVQLGLLFSQIGHAPTPNKCSTKQCQATPT